ncbi:hypothetical protein CEXT_308291 [Caerostris extrusa]|uniref:Uncharacterized protein n=1 Tax=Caerostris extrusa TaxID=172846 RepID=A0AAV4T9R9_CAEEX|nr:hypothetical protein CEXT_308291 [Caerostris extrusa]
MYFCVFVQGASSEGASASSSHRRRVNVSGSMSPKDGALSPVDGGPDVFVHQKLYPLKKKRGKEQGFLRQSYPKKKINHIRFIHNDIDRKN